MSGYQPKESIPEPDYRDVTKRDIDEQTANIVNTIVLMRIYDVLLLILDNLNPTDARRVAEGHENGQFLSSNPSVRPRVDDPDAG